MISKKFSVATLAETEKLARAIGRMVRDEIKNNVVLNLNGDLGSGKTTFTRYFIEEFNGGQDVHSPTFTLMNIYPGAVPAYHFDFYRLDREEELVGIDIEDYLPPENGISIIEWGDKFNTILPEDCINLDFFLEDEHRQIILSSCYPYPFPEQL